MKRSRCLILLLSICLLSCIYSRITHLSKDDLEWFHVYEEGDTIYFNSLKNGMDTLIITNRTIFNSSFPFMENEASSEYIANGSYEYKMFHKGEIFEGILVHVRKEDNERPACISFSLCGFYSDYLNPKENKQVIGGDVLTDCIIINCSNAHNGLNQKNIGINCIIWSKSIGIVRFDTNEDSFFSQSIRRVTEL